MIYTGIGARLTPATVLKRMFDIAVILGRKGYTLRSGGADGADSEFENGAMSVGGNMEIYLPWPGFNNHNHPMCYTDIPREAFLMAERFHPAWHNLSNAVRKLMARNVLQIFGEDMVTQTDFVICWTPDGLASGGTGQAIRIAEAYGIPVYNLMNGGLPPEILGVD